ncbi:hypothetical protein BDZ91DRAFT_724042 [Kalaharituber pfeilii]|nr:hypothetical protein BDZ91DRAFT_724042 [Kalaharituber pfeilii]
MSSFPLTPPKPASYLLIKKIFTLLTCSTCTCLPSTARSTNTASTNHSRTCKSTPIHTPSIQCTRSHRTVRTWPPERP